MADRKLSLALENLLARGELSQEAADKVLIEFTKIDGEPSTRRRIISEVAGYLGGLFILTSLLILVHGRWQHLSRLVHFLLFIFTALLLFGASLTIGSSKGARGRLTGVLNVAASTSVTFALIAFENSGRGSVAISLLIGWLFLLATYIYNRTIFGELSLAVFSLALGISGTMLLHTHLGNSSYRIAIVLFVLGFSWIPLAENRFFNRTTGGATAMVALFLAGQFMFNGEFRYLTYLIYIATVACASWVYSRSLEWPLLVGSVIIITVGMGEFVGGSLGGSVGAALGLLTSGILFVSGSAYSFRRVKRQRRM